jgi:hypothetical protein
VACLVHLIEDTIQLPTLYHHWRNIYTEQILSGSRLLTASIAQMADVVRSVVIEVLIEFGSRMAKTGLPFASATSPLG